MSKPDFFIVGAPKCGTTALSEYLKDHPDVFMCDPKEPHYFAVDLPGYRAVTTEEEYLKLFDVAENKCLRYGEASVFYLYSKKAIKLIKEFNPKAMIIVMLRNPVELVHSMHSQLLYTRDENIEDFSMAWSVIHDRKKGINIPATCRDSKLLFYDEIAKLGEQLKNVYDNFPVNQVKIIFSDDFFSNTGMVYGEVLDFLGLKDDQRTTFPQINQNKMHRVSILANFTQRPPSWLVNIVMVIKNAFGVKRLGFLKRLRDVNSVKKSRVPISDNLKHKIIENYKDDIVNLSISTGRDLTHWLV